MGCGMKKKKNYDFRVFVQKPTLEAPPRTQNGWEKICSIPIRYLMTRQDPFGQSARSNYVDVDGGGGGSYFRMTSLRPHLGERTAHDFLFTGLSFLRIHTYTHDLIHDPERERERWYKEKDGIIRDERGKENKTRKVSIGKNTARGIGFYCHPLSFNRHLFLHPQSQRADPRLIHFVFFFTKCKKLY